MSNQDDHFQYQVLFRGWVKEGLGLRAPGETDRGTVLLSDGLNGCWMRDSKNMDIPQGRRVSTNNCQAQVLVPKLN